MFHHKKRVAAQTVGFTFEADLQTSTDEPWFFAVMDNTDTFHKLENVVAETVGFRFEADPFETVPMVLSFGCHGQF